MRVVRNRRKKGTDEKGHESARGGVRGGRAKEDRMVKRKGREREIYIYIYTTPCLFYYIKEKRRRRTEGMNNEMKERARRKQASNVLRSTPKFKDERREGGKKR